MVAGLWVLYVAVGNIVLRTGVLRGWLNVDEQALRVEYDSAWTELPGRIHVRGLTVRSQSRDVQFLLGLERATLLVNPIALLHRTFQVTRVRADGATFRLRRKLPRLEGYERDAASYPPIPGFADPPIRRDEPDLPIPESEYRLWTVELGDVSASMRELWVMQYRYRGSGSVAGAFRLRPERELWVDPSALTTEGGVLSIGDRELLLPSKGRLEARVDPFDVRVPKGLEVFRHVTARLSLEGDVTSVEPLQALYLHGTGAAARRGAGHLSIDGRVTGGVLAPGSRLTFTTDDLELDAPVGSIVGDVRAEALVDQGLTAEIHVGGASFVPRGARGSAITARDAHASFELGSADVAHGERPSAANVSVDALSVPALRRLQPLAPEHVSLEGGSATASLRALWNQGALQARVDVALERTRARAGPVDVTASGRAWVTIASAEVARFIGVGPAGADLSDVALSVGDTSVDGLWATLRVHEAGVRPSRDGTATIHLDAGPGDRALRMLSGIASLPDVAADAASGPELAADLRVQRQHGATAFVLLRAKDGDVDARGRVVHAGSATNGAFLVEVGPVRTGIEVRNGRIRAFPFVRPSWLDEKLRSASVGGGHM